MTPGDGATGGAVEPPGHGDAAEGSYEWLQRGLDLLERGDAAAAATVLERVAAAEPSSASVLEALARAQFTSGRTGAAVRSFARLSEVSPDSDYARFGYGLALRKMGRLELAVEQLALAAAMRPDRREYVEALGQVRSALQPRPARDAEDADGTDSSDGGDDSDGGTR